MITKENVLCITNNPLVFETGIRNIRFQDVSVLELFYSAMHEIEAGARLLSHPLYGSIRPDITPYKSVLLESETGEVDPESIDLIMKAIRYAEDLYSVRETPLYRLWGETAKKDFQEIDYSIVERALEIEQM